MDTESKLRRVQTCASELKRSLRSVKYGLYKDPEMVGIRRDVIRDFVNKEYQYAAQMEQHCASIINLIHREPVSRTTDDSEFGVTEIIEPYKRIDW